MENTEIWNKARELQLGREFLNGLDELLTSLESDNKQLTLCGVVSSAWYCKISTAKGQWFEIVTGKNEMDVAVKITEKFGKETVYNLIDRYELM